jgi:hypothetical protein
LLGSLNLHENNPGNKVTSDSLFKGKKVVLFGVPRYEMPFLSSIIDFLIPVQRFHSRMPQDPWRLYLLNLSVHRIRDG